MWARGLPQETCIGRSCLAGGQTEPWEYIALPQKAEGVKLDAGLLQPDLASLVQLLSALVWIKPSALLVREVWGMEVQRDCLQRRVPLTCAGRTQVAGC